MKRIIEIDLPKNDRWDDCTIFRNGKREIKVWNNSVNCLEIYIQLKVMERNHEKLY